VNLESMPVHESTPSDSSEPSTALDVGVDAVSIPVDFDTFFAESFDTVANALGLTLDSAEIGKDAASEAMARAFQRWSKVGRYDNPAGWVYRVGLNWARSRRRKWRREVHLTEPPDPGTEDPLHNHALIAALKELPIDQRSVVVLRYYLDLSEADTASALDIAPGTVSSRLSRALDKLAVTMGEQP
jgi:RNA polymerase sigma-70 factor (ECF subfamily)